ncbi:hypothetical protein CHRY9393_00401 [Chryseobacterium fistulae]|uniref:Uncharacterized protein n=1 Tax=Chryseobacterium fistulae TaxID=2675058 RepID=A0A6N4XRS2_9FLAO|nr:hypothetical protein CHRY9393_00401 [Chryseobacterium fistulae]
MILSIRKYFHFHNKNLSLGQHNNLKKNKVNGTQQFKLST